MSRFWGEPPLDPREPSDREIQEQIDEAYNVIDLIGEDYLDHDPEDLSPKKIQEALSTIDEYAGYLKLAQISLQEKFESLFYQLVDMLIEKTEDIENILDYIPTLGLWSLWDEKEGELYELIVNEIGWGKTLELLLKKNQKIFEEHVESFMIYYVAEKEKAAQSGNI